MTTRDPPKSNMVSVIFSQSYLRALFTSGISECLMFLRLFSSLSRCCPRGQQMLPRGWGKAVKGEKEKMEKSTAADPPAVIC